MIRRNDAIERKPRRILLLRKILAVGLQLSIEVPACGDIEHRFAFPRTSSRAPDAIAPLALHRYRTKPVLLPAVSRRSSPPWLQVLKHSSSSFPSQAMHPPPPAHGPPPEGRDWRGRKTMEETMRVLTINELMRLTRIELCGLVNRITNELPKFPDSSPERANALTSLRNIRYVLTRRDYSP